MAANKLNACSQVCSVIFRCNDSVYFFQKMWRLSHRRWY